MWLIPDVKVIEKELNNLYNEMDSFLENKIREYSISLLPVNVYEDDNNDVKVVVPISGVDKNKINVEYKNNSLYIGVEKIKDVKDCKLLREERFEGKLERIIELKDIDPDTIKANYENGVLTITMKKKEGLVKKIAIE
jgi:HSP20 family molecular chaperone IbpA